MKKNVTLIALAAAAMLISCGGAGNTEKQAAATQTVMEKPKVKVSTVTLEAIPQIEEFSTTVEAETKNNIAPNSPLRIERILVEVGDVVRKGQTLVQLDASALDQLRLQISQQELQFSQQKTDFGRIEELYKVGGVSFAEYDNAKTQLEVTRKSLEVSRKSLANRLENTILTSPINGVVSARNYDNGDMCGGLPILVVEQISPVKMKINVSESRYNDTQKGLEVSLAFNTFGDERFEGRIDIISPTINAATHTFPVEITLDNKDKRVRPGMFGKVYVNFGTKEHVVVPDAAVVKQAGSGEYYVYVYADGKVEHKTVELGRRMDNRYEIISGIENGAQVVVAGQNGLTNGSEVEVIE